MHMNCVCLFYIIAHELKDTGMKNLFCQVSYLYLVSFRMLLSELRVTLATELNVLPPYFYRVVY
jgi:hypothetical protein